jgi:transitional endoplasmic reticulum ATPase
MTERRGLEERLLGDPFDRATREEYAALLLAEGAFEASLQQWQLVLKQHPTSAKPHLGLAQCQQRLGQQGEAERELALAKTCADFDPADPLLAGLPGASAPGDSAKEPARLRVVGGEKRSAELAEVIDLSSAKVRFHDVVGMEELKKVLRLRIIEPFLRPGLFERFKKKSGGGVLLYGPPGCGKTMIARAIANECHAKFSTVGISEILNMWIGESERNLANLFQKARSDTPGVLFFDELDALAFSRSKASSDHTRTLVNEFLNQLDGMTGNNDKLLILAATNMPWDVDEAMKRPGRFDRQVFVPPPDLAARGEMYRVKLRGVPTQGVDPAVLAARSEYFSGADVDGVLERAKDVALMRTMDSTEDQVITQADLLRAIEDTSPSTTDWMKTARNLVKFGGAGKAYQDVEKYLRANGLY